MRLGALDYISKISFDGADCDQILERVDRKYKDNLLKKEKGRRITDYAKAGKCMDEHQMDI